jgi:hypothetical protein
MDAKEWQVKNHFILWRMFERRGTPRTKERRLKELVLHLSVLTRPRLAANKNNQNRHQHQQKATRTIAHNLAYTSGWLPYNALKCAIRLGSDAFRWFL